MNDLLRSFIIKENREIAGRELEARVYLLLNTKMGEIIAHLYEDVS